MAHSDPGEILLLHHRWANERLLDACKGLTDEQLDRPFEMGPGTLRRTLTHIISAIRRWGDLLAGRELSPMIEDDTLSVVQLREHLERTTTDFEHSARTHEHSAIVTRELRGTSFSFTRGGVLTHVMTHGMHHRAQCLNMLRHLGVKPMPASSVMEWMMQVDQSPTKGS